MKAYLTAGVLLATQILVTAQGTMGAAPAASPVTASPESAGATIFWIGAVIFACVAAAGGIVLARKLHQQKALVAAGVVTPPERAARKLFSLPSNGNGNGHTNGNGTKSLKLGRAGKSAKTFNNNHANGNNANGKRRRMFNYHKFYTEMVLQGPSPTSAADNPYGYYNGYYVEYETPRMNNNGNGHTNGNGSSNGHDHHSSESPESNGARSAHADLIATQKALIEDQQRLIHEQARLIEEKSRLIAEKNQLLERQSQMIDNHLL